MRILIVNYEYPPLGGGGGNASEQIAKRLVGYGHDVTVVTSAFKGLAKSETRDGVKIVRIPTLRRRMESCHIAEMAVFLASSLKQLPSIALQSGAQVIIAFFSLPCGPAALWSKRTLNIPYLLALRGGDVPGFLPEQLAGWHLLTNWITRRVWLSASAITANSDGLGALARTFLPEAKVQTISNGVDERYFLTTKKCTDPSHLNLLFVGRLTRQKRVDRLLDVMQKLRSSDAFRLRIAGDGPESNALKALARERDLRSVEFLGWCDRAHLLEEYRRADVFLMASDFEGMPNVVLEAMAAGLPVVATASAGTVDLVRDGKTGYVVSAEYADEFVKHLQALHNDRISLDKLSRGARDCAGHFTWDAAARSYEGLCRATLRI